MSQVLDILKNVAQRADKKIGQTLSNDETMKDYLLRQFNVIYRNFNVRHSWPWRESRLYIQTVANYTTGTITVTNGSRTVTGSGTSWDSTLAGRFLKLNRENEIYEVLSVQSATSLTLKVPYLAASGGSLSYLIWKKFYTLPPVVPQANDITIWQYPRKSYPISYRDFDAMFDTAYLDGDIQQWTWHGLDNKPVTYSTGTVKTTKDSTTLTGVGTSWLGNIEEGAEITIQSDTYHVQSVDSDTSITMVQKAIKTIATAVTYSIESNKRCQISFSSVPSTRKNIEIVFYRRVYDLINDKDNPLIYPEYEIALENILYAYLLDKLSSEKSLSWLAVAESSVKETLKNLQENSPVESATRNVSPVIHNYRRSLYG